MIASALAVLLLAAVLLAVRYRRLRFHADARAAVCERIERREFLGRLTAEVEVNRLAARLADVEADRDALQIVAANHLRRAWRAERAYAELARSRPPVVLFHLDPAELASSLATEIEARAALEETPVPDDASGLGR